ncbi:hypothetical protein QMO42_31305, partial [Pseudomonas aeruginosa]|nr:hypothetical protein [Pseudomonas aeruginosa]
VWTASLVGSELLIRSRLLSLLSPRPLQGRWQWSEDGEGWRLVVELQERDGRE